MPRLAFAVFTAALILALSAIGSAQSEKPTTDEKPATKPESPAPETKSDSSSKDAEKEKEQEKPKTPTKPKIETATFGGGCFWCSEAVFQRIPGVISVTSGYSGGNVPNPSYEMVCTGLTGHAEVVQIEFDSSIVPYDKLLSAFWAHHDPTTPNQQGDDFGPNYRSIILYHNDAQKQAALKSYQDLKARRVYRRPIVTELVKFEAFFPAEAYHQNYYNNHRGDNYSNAYIEPKLRKMHLKPPSTKSKIAKKAK
jgi:peptide-methionine (S)-S-oxide reductase